MPNALRTSKDGYIIGQAFLPTGMSTKKAVHDGDTVDIVPNSYLATRLLGIDAPEISFTLPGSEQFLSTGNPLWEKFLANPFDDEWPTFKPALSATLKQHLVDATGPGCATSHARHAKAAEAKLTTLIQANLDASTADHPFGFFLAFGYDVLDRYGRFLCYLHHDDKQLKPSSYNEQMLAAGLVSPYFIWPNVQPFLKNMKVPKPGQLITNGKLDGARDAVKTARENHIGIFDTADPLRLQPHELRVLARADAGGHRKGPDRWVIDLSQPTDQLLGPERYIEIPNVEDRLYVSPEHAPLFESQGWVKAS